VTSLLRGVNIQSDRSGNLTIVFHAPIGIQLIGLVLAPSVVYAGYELAIIRCRMIKCTGRSERNMTRRKLDMSNGENGGLMTIQTS